MAQRLYIGTVGMAVWFSNDLGQTWARPHSEFGFANDSRVWSLASHPSRPGQILAGSDRGIYRWEEAEGRWHHQPSPLDEVDIWSLAYDPRDPNVLMAGVCPAGFWRSEDGGESWHQAQLHFPAVCQFGVIPRVTSFTFDPIDPDWLWASVEIDAIYRSTDRGRTWVRLNAGLGSDDVHDLEIVVVDDKRRLFATTNRGFHRSDDDGETWKRLEMDTPWQYYRVVKQRADRSGTIFLGNGNGPPGDQGRLFRSRDFGESWAPVPLPADLNSTVWRIATDASDPMLVFACTNLGQIFRSEDGGERWTKLRRELGEIRTALWRTTPD